MGGVLNREGGLLNFLPLKGGGGLFEKVSFREDLRSSFYNQQGYKNVQDLKGLLFKKLKRVFSATGHF